MNFKEKREYLTLRKKKLTKMADKSRLWTLERLYLEDQISKLYEVFPPNEIIETLSCTIQPKDERGFINACGEAVSVFAGGDTMIIAGLNLNTWEVLRDFVEAYIHTSVNQQQLNIF